MQNKISILSTRPLNSSLIDEAKRLNIEIDELSFIETETIRSKEVQQEIETALLQSSVVVFTSMNAVEAVADVMDSQQPEWKIYSIGNSTKQLVKKYFGEQSIAGTANSAVGLAKLIVEERQDAEIIFFCGDQRRDELPETLRSHDIGVNEIVVYETVIVRHKVNKPYQGILFFSSSAVEGFFSNNKVSNSSVLFAIGNTTANSLKKYTDNKIIISEEPGKENLFRKMIEYFNE